MNSTDHTSAGGSKYSWIGAILLALAVIAAGIVLLKARKTPDAVPDSASVAAATNTTGASTQADEPVLSRLVGKWLRPDGGYVLDIRIVASDGKIEAGYFNPSPIRVSRAEASRQDGAIKVFVELRDVNYPGCTYTLKYDPESDSMEGVYYQAALQESFDVKFVRLPPDEG